MPEDRKNQSKGNKNEPKEQRRARQGRQKVGNVEKKSTPVENNKDPLEKKAEGTKVTVPQKPVYEDPGPEFYKNLKRETDEILKITEEANSKYKSKEIQSNWAKYEMPIETYDEVEEQENMGADYEKLIETPLSIGGHFQFKHEKSWDINTGPSIYDKYFEINMNDLAIALSTLPFYERNNINQDIFSATEILTMNNRATKYKQKYYNDKSYTTPELETHDKILNNIKEDMFQSEEKINISKDIQFEGKTDVVRNVPEESTIELKPSAIGDDLTLKSQSTSNSENTNTHESTEKIMENITPEPNTAALNTKYKKINTSQLIDDIDDLILDSTDKQLPNKEIGNTDVPEIEIPKLESKILKEAENTPTKTEQPKNPVIQSPEDLEKWLDDFLDDE
ncbi:uncharacterized protein LOC113512886 isoform X1 [Galleria mellonella]|uniref:Uncharacterized protein LOC113512886 isoform X1 n=1 Tax=Galleria mellonella TaxID=7137 RepID=A0A6J1WN30_GALME|nr:uncharacterized protein LOC113512886 isoform X1 [Galleria mellonella]